MLGFYFGLGISCFLRTIVVQFLALRDKDMVMKCFRSVIKYVSITGIIVGCILAVTSPLIATAFFKDAKMRTKMRDSVIIYSFHLFINLQVPIFNSIFRYLEMKKFILLINIFLYNFLIHFFSILLIFVLDFGFYGFMLSYLLAEVVLMSILLIVFYMKAENQIEEIITK